MKKNKTVIGNFRWVLTFLIAAILIMAGAFIVGPSSAQINKSTARNDRVELPAGYRDWKMISIASVGAPFSDLRVKLGNNIAIKAYREKQRPFPDGTIIARLAYKQVTSEENNKVFRAAAAKQGLGEEQIEKFLATSFIAGAPTNIQFMVKDSKKYATTGGWGFAQFRNGKPDGEAEIKTCFSCHAPAKDHDFVFTQYSP